jgi:hypothetical protein
MLTVSLSLSLSHRWKKRKKLLHQKKKRGRRNKIKEAKEPGVGFFSHLDKSSQIGKKKNFGGRTNLTQYYMVNYEQNKAL